MLLSLGELDTTQEGLHTTIFNFENLNCHGLAVCLTKQFSDGTPNTVRVWIRMAGNWGAVGSQLSELPQAYDSTTDTTSVISPDPVTFEPVDDVDPDALIDTARFRQL